MAWRAPTAQPRERRRGPGGGVLAIVVLIAMCLLWWLFSGNGPGGPDGNAQRLAVPDAEATGPSSPTSSPTAGVPGAVRIEGYVPEAGDRVALNYRSGPTRCVGELDTPQVIETDAAVTVTLMLMPPASPPARCRDDLELHTVRISLDAPLEGRSLLDGSRAQPTRVREDATANE